MSHDALEELAVQVDRAVEAIESLDDAARGKALALQVAIEAFHRAGLTTIVRRLKADGRGKELLFELVDDPAVRVLFAMHGLVRMPEIESEPEPLELVQIQLPVIAAGTS
jgi:hypothetical protein